MPFITNSINNIDKILYTKLIGWYFFFYSLYNKFIEYNIGKTNFDFSNNGYSSIWLITLYIIGGYIGKFYIDNPLFPNIILLFAYLLSSFATCEYTFYNIKKHKIMKTILIDYNSPTIIIQAISLTLFFSHLKINHKYIQNIIIFFNPLNFNVALIHMRILSFRILTIKNFLKYVNNLNRNYLYFKINGISIIIYLICAYFDYLRALLFKIMKIIIEKI